MFTSEFHIFAPYRWSLEIDVFPGNSLCRVKRVLVQSLERRRRRRTDMSGNAGLASVTPTLTGESEKLIAMSLKVDRHLAKVSLEVLRRTASEPRGKERRGSVAANCL